MCNFASMIQNLPDIIKENNDFQQALLKQEGGIVSYLAGHLDADGIDALYEGYRAQCMKVYRDEHKWDMMEDMIVHGALGDNHIRKELAYQVALRSVLSHFPNMADAAICFIADYLNFAFEKSHTELYPINVVNDMEFYEEVIIQYIDKLFGRAHRCLWLALNEHRGKAKAEKNETELWEEFELQKYSRVYRSGEEKLRRAVKELIDEKTRGKDKGECRQICREEAKKVMKRLWSFTRLVNGDDDILELHLKENPRLYETWSSKDLELRGASVSFIERQKKHISKEEKAWLRQDMSYQYSSSDTADDKGLSPIQECFQRYYCILEDIGSMWAVQLKEYGIEICELEKETGCILNNNGFFVEHSLGGRWGKVCVIRHEDDGVETKHRVIMEYVGRLKDMVKDEYASDYDKMWAEILSLKTVKSKVYKKGRQKDTTFNRNLVANIIHLMKENGVFKTGTTEVCMARILEPKDDGKEHEIKGRGEDHPIKGALYNTIEDKSIKNDVEKVILKYLKSEM